MCRAAGADGHSGTPIARFLAGEIGHPVVDACTTEVSGLQLPAPPDGGLAAEHVHAADGWGTHVGDDRTMAAQRLLAHLEGLLVEPASAVGLACAQHDLQTGRLDRATPIVLLLTGSGLKDLATVEGWTAAPPVSDLAQLPGRVRAWHGMLDREAR